MVVFFCNELCSKFCKFIDFIWRKIEKCCKSNQKYVKASGNLGERKRYTYMHTYILTRVYVQAAIISLYGIFAKGSVIALRHYVLVRGRLSSNNCVSNLCLLHSVFSKKIGKLHWRSHPGETLNLFAQAFKWVSSSGPPVNIGLFWPLNFFCLLNVVSQVLSFV